MIIFCSRLNSWAAWSSLFYSLCPSIGPSVTAQPSLHCSQPLKHISACSGPLVPYTHGPAWGLQTAPCSRTFCDLLSCNLLLLWLSPGTMFHLQPIKGWAWTPVQLSICSRHPSGPGPTLSWLTLGSQEVGLFPSVECRARKKALLPSCPPCPCAFLVPVDMTGTG